MGDSSKIWKRAKLAVGLAAVGCSAFTLWRTAKCVLDTQEHRPTGKKVVIIIEAKPSVDRDDLIQNFEQYVDDFNRRTTLEDISLNGRGLGSNSSAPGSGTASGHEDDFDGASVARSIYLEIEVVDKKRDDGYATVYFSFPDTNINNNAEYYSQQQHTRRMSGVSSGSGWEDGGGALHMRSTPQFVSTDMLDSMNDQGGFGSHDSNPLHQDDEVNDKGDEGPSGTPFRRTSSTSLMRFRRRCCVIPLPDNRIYRGVPEVVDRQLRCCNVANGIDVIYHAATASAFVDEGINNCSFYNCSTGVINTVNEGVLPALHASPSPQRSTANSATEYPRLGAKGWGGGYITSLFRSILGKPLSTPTISRDISQPSGPLEEQTWEADDATRALVDEANNSDGLRSIIHEAAFECVMYAPRYMETGGGVSSSSQSATQSGMNSRTTTNGNMLNSAEQQPPAITHAMAGTLENRSAQSIPALCTMITDVTMRAELYLRDVTVSNQDVFVSDGIVADAVAAAAVRHHGGSFSSLRECIEETFGVDCFCVSPPRSPKNIRSSANSSSGSMSPNGSPNGTPVLHGSPTYPAAAIHIQPKRKLISNEQELSDWLVEHRITFMSAMTTVSGSNRLESCFGSDAPNFAFLRCAFDSLLFVKVLYTLAVEKYPDWTAETFGVYINEMFSHDREEVISHHTRIFRALNKTRSGSISYEELCAWLARKLSTRSSLPPDQHLVASLMSIRLPLLLFIDRRSLWSNYLCSLKSVSDDEVHV